MTPYYNFKKLIYVFIEHRLIYVREKGLSFLTDRTQFFFSLLNFNLKENGRIYYTFSYLLNILDQYLHC